MSESTAKHKANAPLHLNFALITISTSLYENKKSGGSPKNLSGDRAIKLIEESGNKVVYYEIISDSEVLIKNSLAKVLEMPNVDAIITCGGTGITQTDITIETVTPILEKELPGFGELFRKISYENIGSAAIITRATAGIINRKVVFCLPGSPQAAEMGLTSLIIPETAHIVKHAKE